MSKNKHQLDRKIQIYMDDLFAGVGASQQLFELKEELTTNIREKIADFQSRGMDEKKAFHEAIISMGDLSGLIDDMRQLGQDTAKQAVYTSMTTRISTAGIITGVLLILFGLSVASMIYFMTGSGLNAVGVCIFLVGGGALLTYSILTRETKKKFAMKKIRAALYALSIGLILFGLFVAAISGFATGKAFVAIASLMMFELAGIGLWLSLFLTEKDRRKPLQTT